LHVDRYLDLAALLRQVVPQYTVVWRADRDADQEFRRVADGEQRLRLGEALVEELADLVPLRRGGDEAVAGRAEFPQRRLSGEVQGAVRVRRGRLLPGILGVGQELGQRLVVHLVSLGLGHLAVQFVV